MNPDATDSNARLLALGSDHVRELATFIAGLRTDVLKFPDVDPTDGGVRARGLILLESPGRKAVKSGFVSFDNPDESARNLTKLLGFSGIDRRDVVLWNACPYCVCTEEENRNATKRQILGALPETKAFIQKLQNLRVVVLCGRRAQWASESLRTFLPTNVELKETFHPGAKAYNKPVLRRHMECTFTEVARIIYAADQVRK